MPRRSRYPSLIILALLLAGGAAQYYQHETGPAPQSLPESAARPATLTRATSGQWAVVQGRVIRTLADDRDGSQHQRFILAVGEDHTLLVAHNIDLAPRIPLRKGDSIQAYGRFEWNDRGGVLHWTHHDPGGSQGGWIEHEGRRYE